MRGRYSGGNPADQAGFSRINLRNRPAKTKKADLHFSKSASAFAKASADKSMLRQARNFAFRRNHMHLCIASGFANPSSAPCIPGAARLFSDSQDARESRIHHPVCSRGSVSLKSQHSVFISNGDGNAVLVCQGAVVEKFPPR